MGLTTIRGTRIGPIATHNGLRVAIDQKDPHSTNQRGLHQLIGSPVRVENSTWAIIYDCPDSSTGMVNLTLSVTGAVPSHITYEDDVHDHAHGYPEHEHADIARRLAAMETFAWTSCYRENSDLTGDAISLECRSILEPSSGDRVIKTGQYRPVGTTDAESVINLTAGDTFPPASDGSTVTYKKV